MNAPGKNYLKVVGIIIIVLSSIDILVSLAGMDDKLVGLALSATTGVPLPFLVLNSIFGLFMGIMGVIYCNTPEKGKFLFGISIIDIAIYAIFLITAFQWSYLYSIPLSILYLVGAVKNKNANGYNSSYYVSKRCRQCSNIYHSGLNCPSCGSSLYEEIQHNSSIINTENTWSCKKCNEVNPISSSICKGCGSYK